MDLYVHLFQVSLMWRTTNLKTCSKKPLARSTSPCSSTCLEKGSMVCNDLSEHWRNDLPEHDLANELPNKMPCLWLCVCRHRSWRNHFKRFQNVWSGWQRPHSQRRVSCLFELRSVLSCRVVEKVHFAVWANKHFCAIFPDYRNYWWHKQTSFHLRR